MHTFISETVRCAQYFMCQQDPYTDLSEHMDISKWEGKCCHRMDDKWQPFIPPVWYYYDRKQPHVTSGYTDASRRFI